MATVPDQRPTDPRWILDEIHRLEALRDSHLATLHALEVELDEQTALRVLARVDSGQSVAAAERAVVPEMADTRRRFLSTRSTVDRAANLISHYRFLHSASTTSESRSLNP
jgi:hypothetical protein